MHQNPKTEPKSQKPFPKRMIRKRKVYEFLYYSPSNSVKAFTIFFYKNINMYKETTKDFILQKYSTLKLVYS